MFVPRKTKVYKVRADQDDWRDLLYKPTKSPLREQVDMRNWASPVENQSQLGSCTGNAIVGAYELLLNKEIPQKYIELSRLFVYYNSRLIEGTVDTDTGAYIRDGIKAVKKYGICSERVWPYDISNFSITPTPISYNDAKTRNIKNYYRLSGLEDILDALNQNWPVVFSMKVYDVFDELFESDDYTIHSPDPDESPIGGHAMCLVGYDMKTQRVLARNSFGPNWCIYGYCWIDFSYVKSEIMDSWIFDVDLTEVPASKSSVL
jgi:C1A family cysteine protease